MSRVGRKPILIPDDVEVDIEGQKVRAKGPKGSLDFDMRPEIKAKIEDDKVVVFPEQETKQTPALWGLTRARIANIIKGVRQGYQKKLEIKGLGYRARVEKGKLILEVGYSHPVEIKKPSGIEFEVEKNMITVSGIDKSKLGEVAAKIRNVKPPEPYKGKGIRYEGEQVKRKEGKKVVGTLEE